MGSDKSNPADLDIWGSPRKGPTECFRCGITYRIEESNAPEDYAATYCSHSCYNEDMNEMLAKISPAEQFRMKQARKAEEE